MTVTSLPSQEPSRAALIKKLGAFSMRSQREGDVHTINVIGEMDLASTGDVEQLLIDVEASDACVIFVDLSAVTFMDSSAIRMFVCAYARSRANGNRLALRRPPDSVRRVHGICGVDGLLPLPTDDAARGAEDRLLAFSVGSLNAKPARSAVLP